MHRSLDSRLNQASYADDIMGFTAAQSQLHGNLKMAAVQLVKKHGSSSSA
jgi:hypothetical protein